MNTAERMRSRKWGIFNHFICTPGRDAFFGDVDLSDWKKTVNGFDAEKVARQLHEMGAGYYFITLIHGTEHMIAPNRAFEKMFAMVPGEVCPDRDIVEDLYVALQKYDIDLCLYFNCLSPYNGCFEERYREHIGINGPINDQRDVLPLYNGEWFVEQWAGVLKEFAVRYGDKVKMWWLDSCYDKSGYRNDMLKQYYDAIKAGNPDALIGFNKAELITNPNGDLKKSCPYEEFTCGECGTFHYIPKSPDIDGALSHLLIPLGIDQKKLAGPWCAPDTAYERAFIQDYIQRVNDAGGIVTVDIYVAPDGSFDPRQTEVLRK